MTDRIPDKWLQEMRRLSDRDLMIRTAVEVKSMAFSIDQLRENGCLKYADIQAVASGQSEAIKNLREAMAARRNGGFQTVALLLSAAAMVLTLLMFIYVQAKASDAKGQPPTESRESSSERATP